MSIFVYKNDVVILSKVSAINFDDESNEIEFYMDGDWEYTIEIDESDVIRVKEVLLKQLSQPKQ